jgi:hypothetical protein
MNEQKRILLLEKGEWIVVIVSFFITTSLVIALILLEQFMGN